jgi:phosphate transport system permease protein
MAAVTAAQSVVDLRRRTGSRVWRDRLATAALTGSLVVVLVPIVLILLTVITKGAPTISWKFLTSDIAASERRATGGIGPAIVGTVLAVTLASLIAIPLGILGAVYLHEYGRHRPLARLIRFMTSVMAGVPSVVMGLFVYVVWTLTLSRKIDPKGGGLSAFGGALALACLMLPVVIRSTEEMLKLVPNHLREASFGLGATKSRTILTIVLPAALPGVVSGVLLAVARAAGETAPLLFTIGASKALHLNPFRGANTALPAQIFANANSTFDAAQSRGWAAALTLVVLAFVVTLVARVFSARFATKR